MESASSRTAPTVTRSLAVTGAWRVPPAHAIMGRVSIMGPVSGSDSQSEGVPPAVSLGSGGSSGGVPPTVSDGSGGSSGGVPPTVGLFDGLFGRGAVRTGDLDSLQAMLDAEAALARAAERAGQAGAGAGAAVPAAATAEPFDVAETGRQAAITGNPVPHVGRAIR